MSFQTTLDLKKWECFTKTSKLRAGIAWFQVLFPKLKFSQSARKLILTSFYPNLDGKKTFYKMGGNKTYKYNAKC